MLWLYLLGAVTLLIIVLRRVLRRQEPLNNELYAKNIALEQAPTGVAWVRADGTFGSINPAFARTLNAMPADLTGKEWYNLFPPEQHDRIRDAFAQTLLGGVTSFSGPGVRPDGSSVWLNVRLVAVHDHQMRFAGLHCMIEDRTREHELEQRLSELSGSKRESPAPGPPLVAAR